MRTLSSTLIAAQKAAIADPIAQVIVDDRHVGVFRPRWAPFVTDTVADGFHAVDYTYDGALVRARVDPASGNLYTQRITDPSLPSQWTAWTLLESGISTSCPIVLAADGNTIQALFYVAGNNRAIKVRESTDNGQSWSAASTVTTLASGHAVRSLAASLNCGRGTLYCFYSDELAGVHGSAQIYCTSRAESGGSWSTPQPWGRGNVAITHGLAVLGGGDDIWIVAGYRENPPSGPGRGPAVLAAFTVPLTGLANWPAPISVLRADVETITYRWPAISLTFGSHYFIYFIEKSTRQNAYDRLCHVFTPDWESFSFFPRPYQMASAYGATAVNDATYHYLCTSRYVYKAPQWGPTSEQRADVSNDVVSLRLTEGLDEAGRLEITLRNDDGRYSAVGQSGTYQAIKAGSQVSVRLGYRTSAADEVSYYRPYWITHIVHERGSRYQVSSFAYRSAPDPSYPNPDTRVLIAATDGWGILERAKARQQYAWTDSTVLGVLSAILAAFGFHVTDDGNTAWSTAVPRFAINPGTGFATAVRGLLRMAGGDLIFRMDATWEESWPSAVAHLAVASASSTYSYTSPGLASDPAQHYLLASSFGQDEQPYTHIMVYPNAELIGEAFDWDAIELGNEDRIAMIVDRRLATLAAANARAEDELAAWQRAAAGGFIVVQPNVGQEVLDAITVNDELAGLDEALRLVTANDIALDKGRGLFQQRLALGAIP